MIPQINGSMKMRDEVFRIHDFITVQNEFTNNAVAAFAERMAKKEIRVEWLEYERKADIQSREDKKSSFISIKKNTALKKEAYVLSIYEEKISVEASTEQGVIWALTTLCKNISHDGSIRTCVITDSPQKAHRGLHLDAARHFFPAEEVKRIIEQISLAKMNVFHWHLADDQGWRIESKKYPRLHECSGHYYTQDEIRDVVAYAGVRGVEVIPEIDMPGHTRGILAAYPEYSCGGKKVNLAKVGGIYRVILCAGAEKTYDFLEKLLDEICPLFPSGRFHIGGDEAPKAEWEACPVCNARMKELELERYEDLQGYFSKRAAEILEKHGKQAILWNDSLESVIRPENMQMQYWSVTYNKPSAEFISQGGEWIYSDMFELYLDYPHAMTPVKKIYENHIDLGNCEFDTNNSPYGYEACVWTEYITANEELEKRIFPRVYVLAELAWHGAGDYEEFEARLIEEMKEAEKAGISVTAYENWNPQGQERQQEAFGYMAGMHTEMPKADKDETVDPSGVGEEFQKKFITRFFKEEDIPVLMGSLK